jgi:hypothetical protein
MKKEMRIQLYTNGMGFMYKIEGYDSNDDGMRLCTGWLMNR